MAFKCQRWSAANILPLLFVIWVIGTVWIVYLVCHLRPLMERSWDSFVYQTVVSQTFTALLLVSFVRAVCTDPGSVPDAPEWKEVSKQAQREPGTVSEKEDTATGKRKQQEVKESGMRRMCKWCDHYKPDRTHHCRVCMSCIVRMDHHCPWIVNCVGFHNHKYFMLLVMYSLLSCSYIMTTMTESISRVLVEYSTPTHRFSLVFGMTLASIMATLLAAFFTLHLWMAVNATTTIEFCEKRFRHHWAADYRQGIWQDLKNVLGPQPALWLLPLMPPEGSGIYFPTAEALEALQQEKEGAVVLLKKEFPSPTEEPEPEKESNQNGESNTEHVEPSSRPEVTGESAATV